LISVERLQPGNIHTDLVAAIRLVYNAVKRGQDSWGVEGKADREKTLL